MSRVNTAKITRERLASWAVELNGAHCTPMLLVGFGHDETSGQLHLCTTTDMDMEQIERVLLWALNQIRQEKFVVDE